MSTETETKPNPEPDPAIANQNRWRAEIDALRAEQRKIIDVVDQAKAQIRRMNDQITVYKEKMKAGLPFVKE